MQDHNPTFGCLVDGLRRGLDAYLALLASPPPKPKGRRHRFATFPRTPAYELRRALQEQFPDCLEVAAAAAAANGRDPGQFTEPRTGDAWRFTWELVKFLDFAGSDPDTAAVAHRAADYLAGRPLPTWEYVTVDIAVPVTSVPLFSGWELCSADQTKDPLLPVHFPGAGIELSEFWSPRNLHELGFGALRRPRGTRTLDEDPGAEGDLIWPLMVLNLVGPTPVRAASAYLVEPGRKFVIEQPDRLAYLPAEISAWHTAPLTTWPHRAQAFDATATAALSRYAAEVGACIAALRPADRVQFVRAARHHLYLAYQHDSGTAEPDGSYMAFRRTVAIEALLAGADSDHETIGRKVAQRAALLLGVDDEGRLTARELIRAAYAARSAFAHGSGKAKQVDQPALARATRTIMRRWLALAATHGGKQLALMLDDALLSTTVRDGLLDLISRHEHRAAIVLPQGVTAGAGELIASRSRSQRER